MKGKLRVRRGVDLRGQGGRVRTVPVPDWVKSLLDRRRYRGPEPLCLRVAGRHRRRQRSETSASG